MNISPALLIRKVQDKIPLSKDEIYAMIHGFAEDQIPDYQMSAFLMAIYFQGVTTKEKEHLTQAYLESGIKMDWPKDFDFIDKHSTGGTGDKTSMILNPLLASMGYKVPMMAGRGLGHTGGTLDKLESLKGYNASLSLEDFKKTVLETGGAIIGQTGDFCPADKKIYALRDVTSTVSSLPLITASIVSKKIAEGARALIYDVKTGSGAFVKDFEKSKELAQSLVDVSEGMGAKAIALITDMSQPLGRYVGNACEMYECFEILKNTEAVYHEFEDTIELTLHLTARLIYRIEDGGSYDDIYKKCKEALCSGKAYPKAKEIFIAQGWDGVEPKLHTQFYDFSLPNAQGFISSMDNESIGWASVELGGGRKKLEDKIDPEVGFYFYKKLGDAINPSDALVRIYYNDKEKLETAKQMLSGAFEFTKTPVQKPKLIQDIILKDNKS